MPDLNELRQLRAERIALIAALEPLARAETQVRQGRLVAVNIGEEDIEFAADLLDTVTKGGWTKPRGAFGWLRFWLARASA